MKAILIDAPGEARFEICPDPVIGNFEALVRVKSVGVCAGDLHIFNGRNPYAIYPCIGGHEIAGVIEMVGSDATSWKVGDRVVVEPFIPCGHCYPCRIGKPNCCNNLRILGVHLPGGFAEYVKAPASNLHRIPDSLEMKTATFAEPLGIAIQACNRAAIGEELCLVMGCGPIGLAVVEVARTRGARVIATDLDASRLEMAARLGADARLMDATFAVQIDELTDGEGVPVVFEATGAPEAVIQGFERVASGGRLVILGLIPKGIAVPIPGLDITRKEATILGSRASANCFPEALRLLAGGQISYPSVATNLPFCEGPDVLSALAADPSKYHKAVLVL